MIFLSEKDLFKKYEEEICKNCIAENCEKRIVVCVEKKEGEKQTVCARCVDYKSKDENEYKKPVASWQLW